ncbi:hypothetical protein NP534_23150, partial [Pseudomonas sp. 39004]|uniref:hypothetical protein n=1 Tax=Pseudomonas sp. 39004 TaxID=2967213 RepID=UPI0023637AD9
GLKILVSAVRLRLWAPPSASGGCKVTRSDNKKPAKCGFFVVCDFCVYQDRGLVQRPVLPILWCLP